VDIGRNAILSWAAGEHSAGFKVILAKLGVWTCRSRNSASIDRADGILQTVIEQGAGRF